MKAAKKQAEALIIEYRTNLADALEDSGKGPAATDIRNMQRREEDHTLSRQVNTLKVNSLNQVPPLSLNNKPTAVHCKS